MEEIRKIQERIRSLEIQGARNVAVAGLECLKIAALTEDVHSPPELLSRVVDVARSVSRVRVTEPGLRNVLAQVLHSSKRYDPKDISDLRTFIVRRCDDLLHLLDSNLPNICLHGSSVIKDGFTVFTHCHSSSVTRLIMSEAEKKSLRVFCTETRPRWQGRKTAQELCEHGIDTTLFVDSATHMYMQEAQLVLIGADAVGGGKLYNKIGSYMVIHFANLLGIPAYSVCETQKFDPLVEIGYEQPIEQRPPSEVIEGDVPFNVLNPAFETVPLEMLTGIITEEGVVRPEEVGKVVKKYQYLVPELKTLVDWDRWEDET